MLTPYGGVGIARALEGVEQLTSEETFNKGRFFAGVNLNMTFSPTSAVKPRDGRQRLVPAKIGLRF
jgi:hypothetical protein